MRNFWYLVSSLPHLYFGEKPPLDAEGFRALYAEAPLSVKERGAVEAARENREPPEREAPDWWNGEIQLRNAAVRIRAKDRGAEAAPYLRDHSGYSVWIKTAVQNAFTKNNPLERELELDRIRWKQAEELAFSAPFGLPGILAYARKLGIAERLAAMSDEAGKEKVEELVACALTQDREEQPDE